MADYFFTLGLLAAPILICRTRTCRPGLVTGLFISLFFWAKAVPLLLLIPLSAAFYLCFAAGKQPPGEKNQPYVLNPSLPMLILFMTAMIVFCAFGDAFYRYGDYLMLDQGALTLSRQLSFIALLLGPLIVGNWCDRKGSFPAAVRLAFLAEISVLLASAGGLSLFLFVCGGFLISLSISGFFVLMPRIAAAYMGEANFLRFYPFIAAVSGLFWAIARYQYSTRWVFSANPSGFLLSLSLLTFIAACFVYTAWKRRFVLVRPVCPAEEQPQTGSK